MALTIAPAQAAQPNGSSPSDPRAEFFDGNVTTCADAGFDEATSQLSGGTGDASDDYIVGDVVPRMGGGNQLNVTVTMDFFDDDIVIDGVVVKGGPGYNVYSDAAVLPPDVTPPTRYISPLNNGGNVPNISHWFVCYHRGEPLRPGTLEVNKTVLLPDGMPSEPLPTEFEVRVRCNTMPPRTEILTFGSGGGSETITGLPLGTRCTVTELNTDDFPEGSEVTYDPPGAPDPGVVITRGTAVSVTVTNDFTDVKVKKAKLKIRKILVRPKPGVPTPDHFTVTVTCDDGTEEEVTLPGDGGFGFPVVRPSVGAECEIEETGPGLPFGWKVSYSVNGGPFTSMPPVIEIPAGTTWVTVKNDPKCIPHDKNDRSKPRWCPRPPKDWDGPIPM